MENTIDQAREHTLRIVNELRAELGLDPIDELKPGTRYSASTCPVANSLAFGGTNRVISGQNFIMVMGRAGQYRIDMRTPGEVATFIRLFDTGSYPDLVKGIEHAAE